MAVIQLNHKRVREDIDALLLRVDKSSLRRHIKELIEKRERELILRLESYDLGMLRQAIALLGEPARPTASKGESKGRRGRPKRAKKTKAS